MYVDDVRGVVRRRHEGEIKAYSSRTEPWRANRSAEESWGRI